MPPNTLKHVRSRDLENELAAEAGQGLEAPPMINKPSNLTSNQALGMTDKEKLPHATTFSTLHPTIGATHDDHATNASTFMGGGVNNTLAGAKNTKYRAQFRLGHPNSTINGKTF